MIKYALKTILRDYLNFEGLKYDDIYYKIKDKELHEFTSRTRFARYKQALIGYFNSFSKYGIWLNDYFEKDYVKSTEGVSLFVSSECYESCEFIKKILNFIC